tara:strand:+ start:37 stop:1011 length:975 start_codon:yes stop_codon:yes gene_type:complete
MAQVLNLPNTDYIVKVRDAGTIYLDTGLTHGQVVISGNLTVLGTQTYIATTNTKLTDNIILLNDGETNAGVTLNQSGIQIDRGSLVDQKMVFDETLTWTDPISETLKTGAFTFQSLSGETTGLRINSISTGGGDLYLINGGLGVISVTGTSDYEVNVTDDDHIPNKKYVDDEILSQLSSIFQPRIEQGVISKTYVEVRDFETSTQPSIINFAIDNVVVGNITQDNFEFGEIRIQNNQIETISSDQQLILSAPGTGGILVNDNMTLSLTPGLNDSIVDPSIPDSGIKLYAKNSETGGTGLFFKHSNTKSGEIMSRQSALLFSMLF